jgi:hypothetical protein
MTKPTAHLILVVFDILAVLAVYYVITRWFEIRQLIDERSGEVTYQGYFTLISLIAMIPIIHGFSLIPWKTKQHPLANSLLIAVSILMAVFALFAHFQIEKKLISTGYIYCDELTEVMTFSKFKTYMRPELECLKEN